jgi:hypothetical protein
MTTSSTIAVKDFDELELSDDSEELDELSELLDELYELLEELSELLEEDSEDSDEEELWDSAADSVICGTTVI